MSTTTENIREKLDKFNKGVDTFQERMRVKSSLLGLESRKTADDLSASLDRLRRKLHDVEFKTQDLGERFSLQARLGIMEAEDRWGKIKEYLDELGEQIDDAKGKSQKKFDHARVQSHLARLDATDAIEEKIKDWKKRIAAKKDDGSEEISKALDKMLDGLEGLLVKFKN